MTKLLPSTTLENFLEEVGRNNADHGFNEYDSIPDEYKSYYLTTKLHLIDSETAEAGDEIRSGHGVSERYYREDGKPEGFLAELADVVIRAFGVAYEVGLSDEFLDALVEKHEYNKSREFRHGRDF